MQNASPHDVMVSGPTPPPVVVYSDASFEGGILRLVKENLLVALVLSRKTHLTLGVRDANRFSLEKR